MSRRKSDLTTPGYLKWVGRRLVFELTGESIAGVTFEGPVVIHLGDRRQTRIRLDMPFNLTADGTTRKLSPRLCSEHSLLGYLGYTSIERMSADVTGYLEIVFSNGVSITAPSDDAEFQYEAWHVYNAEGLHLFTPIGGRLSS